MNKSQSLPANMGVLKPLCLQPVEDQVATNFSFPRTPADFKLLKSLESEMPIKAIVFYHDTERTPWKCCGVELVLANDSKVNFGRKIESQTLKNGKAELTRPVKKIKLDARDDDISAIGTALCLRYLDENDQEIDCHEYYTTEFFEMGKATRIVEEGWHLVGISLATDSDGFINWLNFLVWPAGKPIQ